MNKQTIIVKIAWTTPQACTWKEAMKNLEGRIKDAFGEKTKFTITGGYPEI